MEKDESNAMMEVLDATKKLNLVENEPVKSKAVEREQEEVINENSTTDHGLNSLDNSAMQKEIQETLKNSAGILG
jgi:adenine C2-methylase RlmN of 23S rRNA A2503 and tRNA A37